MEGVVLKIEKIKKLVSLLPNNVDAALIVKEKNRVYFTNFCSTDGFLLITKKASFLLLDSRYFEMAKNFIKKIEVILFSNLFYELDKILKKTNVKTLAIESNNTTLKEFEDYKTNLDGVVFEKSSWLSETILSLRSVKTEKEIKSIKASQEIVDLAFLDVLNFMSIGKTEKEIAKRIDGFILDRAQQLAFKTIVASGKNSSLPHATPSEKLIEKGDFVTMDFGAMLDGYCSDMTRTVCVGSVSNFQKDLYDIVLKAQLIGIKMVKKGVVCCELDFAVREFFKQFGFEKEFGHALGHGLGLEIHETPYLNKTCKMVLKENMVVTIEPGIYIYSKLGVRIEDMIVVKKDGVLNLTKSSKKLICV